MRPIPIPTLALTLSLTLSVGAAADGKPAGATLERTHAITLSSSSFDQDYRIQVALPYGYDGSEETYPVVYLLDSDVLFGLVTDVTRLLPLEGVPMFLGEVRVPAVIVVGIGYPGGVAEMSNKRGRDMNPPEGEDGEVNPEGTANFFRFVASDLIPWVESNYRARTTNRTLLGASRAGVFVLSTLFLHPDTFQRYIAISPIIEAPIHGYLDRFATREDPAQARLYLSTGSAGEVETGIAAGVERLGARLDELALTGLDWQVETFDGETHVSVVPKALVEGLVSVFSDPAVPGRKPAPSAR